jgi:hypothetical protein
LTFNGLLGVISKKKELFGTTAVGNSNPKQINSVNIINRAAKHSRP